jgi:hypothetical protein
LNEVFFELRPDALLRVKFFSAPPAFTIAGLNKVFFLPIIEIIRTALWLSRRGRSRLRFYLQTDLQ